MLLASDKTLTTKGAQRKVEASHKQQEDLGLSLEVGTHCLKSTSSTCWMVAHIGYMHRKAMRELWSPSCTAVNMLSTSTSRVLKQNSFGSFGANTLGSFGPHSFASFGPDSSRSFGTDSFLSSGFGTCPGTHSVCSPGLELRDPPVLNLKY
ncbi:hypothetical protein LEMLEM_LOCUS9877 [Lemmus lemmus]